MHRSSKLDNGARSNLFGNAARDTKGVWYPRNNFTRYDYASPAFNEIIKCVSVQISSVGKTWKIFDFRVNEP